MAERTMHWSSQRIFILAAIGSAIGFGNIWRFPYLAYENGGGAFLIPYFIALFVAGIPLMLLELGVGNKTKAGAAQAFRDLVGRKKEWIGWLAVVAATILVTYYAVIIGWAVDYAYFSLDLAYGANPESFFFNDFLATTDGPLCLGA
ncbi:MAG: sodium-dependent transporter, partial [Methanomicrobiales archaeon]|nr:sodium-dependent transporter [Methanomicrobiales archaeon]